MGGGGGGGQCPPLFLRLWVELHSGLFTTGAVDNVDHDSATAKDSFHGTGVSLVQHLSHTNGGTCRGVPIICQGGSSTKSLPSAYTIVRPAAIKTSAPAVHGPVKPSNFHATKAATCMAQQRILPLTVDIMVCLPC